MRTNETLRQEVRRKFARFYNVMSRVSGKSGDALAMLRAHNTPQKEDQCQTQS